MASIYIETIGSDTNKPELVMLHGWAMHGGVMKGLAKRISDQFIVHLVDLPGHGNSPLNGSGFEINNLANDIYQQVSEKLTGKATWLGWSLGGLVAMKITELFSDNINNLILFASNPAFVKHEDWCYGVDKEVFENFSNELRNDLKATIIRFLSLQVRGAENSRQTLKQLREVTFSKDLADGQVLNHGLHMLQDTDLRNLFNDAKVPLLLIGGERDTLVPKSALVELSKSKNVTTSIIEKAGHAPFLSHPEQCIEEIRRFCHVQ